MPLAFVAALLFLIAFVLHAASKPHFVEDFWLAGLCFLALYFAFGSYLPWGRRRDGGVQ